MSAETTGTGTAAHSLSRVAQKINHFPRFPSLKCFLHRVIYLSLAFSTTWAPSFGGADDFETLTYQMDSVQGKNLYQYCFNNPVIYEARGLEQIMMLH